MVSQQTPDYHVGLICIGVARGSCWLQQVSLYLSMMKAIARYMAENR